MRYEAFQIASQITSESGPSSVSIWRCSRAMRAYQWAAHHPRFQQGFRQLGAAQTLPYLLPAIVVSILAVVLGRQTLNVQ
jgi:hypothetical protein